MNDKTPHDEEVEDPTREDTEALDAEVHPPEKDEDNREVASRELSAPRQSILSRIFGRKPRPIEKGHSLQSGFVELMGVMQSIKVNLEAQTRAQSRLLETMEHFPDAVDGLRNIGKMGERQEETLSIVRQQAQDSLEHSRQVVSSINRFDQTLNLMDDTSRQTAQTMTGLAERSRESEEVLRTMLERSERRLTFLLAAMGLLAIVVIGGILFLTVGGGMDQEVWQKAPAESLELNAAPAAQAPPGEGGASPDSSE